MCPTAKLSESPVDAYAFSISEEQDPEQPHNVTLIEAVIKVKASDAECGMISASLVRRPGNMLHGGFHMVTDDTCGSSELGECAQALCSDAGGTLLPAVRSVLEDADQCDTGGLLYIEDVKLGKAHRGHDIGLHAVAHVLSQLQGRWSLAVVFPASTDHEKGRPANTTPAQRDAACVSLSRHFARLGFVQAGEHRPERLYWLLEASAYDGVIRAKQDDLVVHRDPPATVHDHDDAELARRLQELVQNRIGPCHSLLDSLGAHVTGAQFDRVRAVHIAVANELVELLPLLQSAGANINLVDEHGATPLHVAANMFHLPSVTALLTLGAGAAKQVQTLKGDTPLALATQAMARQDAFRQRYNLPAPINAGDIAARQYIPLLLA